MAPPTDRTEILSRLRAQVDNHTPIVGAGAYLYSRKPGIGLSAKSAEAGDVDLIIIYNSGRFRMAGHGSLAGLMPFSNANAVVIDMAPEILSAVTKTPVIAGVCATDPYLNLPRFLIQLRNLGFAGAQNFPTVGLIDGNFRANLEETGMSFSKEVEMIGVASKMSLLTTPYVFDAEQAVSMAKAGADIIVAHMGLTTSGTIGAKTGKTLEECVESVKAIRDAAVSVKPDVIVLCHGGPIASPKDAEFVLKRVKGLHGFYGASSIERLPVEEAIKSNVVEFKNIRLDS